MIIPDAETAPDPSMPDQERLSESRYRRLFESARDGLLILDAATRQITDVNPFMMELLEYSRDEFLGKELFEIGLLQDEQASADAFRQLQENGSIRYDHLPLQTKSGRSIGVEFVSNVYTEGEHQVVQCNVRDITQRKQLEDAKTRLAAIVEHSDDAIIGKALDGTIITWNAGAHRLYGYTAEEVIGRSISILVPADMPDEMPQLLEKVGRGEAIDHYETVRVDKKGQRKDISLSISPLKDAQGNIFGASSIKRDISARKEAEELLRRSAERYRSLALATSQIVWTTSADGMVEDIPAWRELTGQSLEEVRGRGWAQALHPSDLKRIEATIGDCEVIEVYEDEYRVRMAKGDYRFFAVRGVPILASDGSVREWIGTFTDIHDRRQAEEERERFFTLSLEMLAIAGFDGYFKRVNPAFTQVLGFTQAELLATPFLELSHPEDEAATQEAVAKLSQGNTVVGFENRYRTKQGGWRWLEWKSIAILEEGLIFAAARDVTERKHAEEALRRAHDELEIRITERTAQLEEAKREADTANLAKSEFLSRMSHELRTPLNAILGFGQILNRGDLDALDKESVGHILKGGYHLLTLINEVLDIARVEAGHMDLSLEPVALDDVVAESCALVQPLAAERDIRLHKDASVSNHCYVLADQQRLKQVLLNLLSNAIKYNREGGRVDVSCDQTTEGWISIAVHDTGPGIAPTDLPKLFTPFERLNAGDSNIEGTGLGLALSQRLMMAMGGTLTATSTVGQGTTFTLVLPQTSSPESHLINAPSEMLHPEAKEEVRVATSYSVLCIEDNPSNLRLMEAILENRPQIKLLTAIQGSVGLDLARQHVPDLILLDLNLPDIHGSEVLKRLRESALTRELPVVVISADATPKQIERLLDAGAKAYLTKPLDVAEFLSILDKFVHQHDAGEPAGGVLL